MNKIFKRAFIASAALLVCCAVSPLSAADEIPVIEPVMIPETYVIDAQVVASPARVADVHEGIIRISEVRAESYRKAEPEYDDMEYESGDVSFDAEDEDKDFSELYPDDPKSPEDEAASDDISGEEVKFIPDETDIYSHFSEEEVIFLEEEPVYLDYTNELFQFDEDSADDESGIYDESEVDESVGEFEFYLDREEIEQMEESGMRAD